MMSSFFVINEDGGVMLDSQAQALLLDYSQWGRIGGLRAVLAECGIDVPDLEWKAFGEAVAASLIGQLRRLAYCIYQLMVVSGDWTDAGRDACESAFGRCELGLGPEATWGYGEKQKFLILASEMVAAFALEGLSADELKSRVNDASIEVLGLVFTIHEFNSLNRLLMFVGMALILQGGVYGPYREFILGTGTFELKGDYRVFVLTHEVLRSPTTIMPMAAVIGEREIFVRDEAMASVFQMKWASFLPHAFGDFFTYYGVEHRMSALIRRRVFECYGVKSRADLDAVTESFIFDLKETVLTHELGHGVIQYHLLSSEVAPVAESSKMCGESVVTALLEVLADFAPRLGDVKGPLQNMVEVAVVDYARATRMFWMYLSDVWFFDTPDEYMYVYSELMTWVMGSAIGQDLHVDFAVLDRAINARDGILQLALKEVELVVEQLRQIAEAAEFDGDGVKVSFSEFCDFVLTAEVSSAPDQESFSEVFATDEMRAYSSQSLIWMKVFEALMSQDTYKSVILEILSEAETRIQHQFFTCIAGLDHLEGSLRNSVFKRFELVFSTTF